jgi:iron complex outermembrane recepter protein
MKTTPTTPLSQLLRLALIAVFASCPLGGQEDPTTGEDIVELSPFEVEAAANEGYYATNVLSGTRFNTNLLSLPKPIEVITAEMIEDIGAVEIAEVLKYSGSVSDNSAGTPDDITGSHFAIRGYSTFTTYRNGYRSFGIADTLFIDRIEIIKGPSSVFSGTIEPGGTINVITKRPSSRHQGYVRLRQASHDSLRAEAVHTGPLDEGRKLLYRFGIAYEDYGSPYKFAGRERLVAGGNLRFNLSKRTLLNIDGQWIDSRSNPAQPSVYIASNREELDLSIPRDFNRMGPDAFSDLKQGQGNIDFTHTLNDTFSLRLGLYYRYQDLYRLQVTGSTVVNFHQPTGIRSVEKTPRLEDAQSYDYSPQAYLTANFGYAGIKHQVLLGYEYLFAKQENRQTQRVPGFPNINLADPDLLIGGIEGFTRVVRDQSLESVQQGFSFNNVWKFWDERVNLLQGFRYGTAEYETENRVNDVVAEEDTRNADVWNLGLSVKAAPWATVFISYAESYLPQRDIDADGNLFVPITGEGFDFGVKFELLGGRLSGSMVAYAVTRANVPQPDPENPGWRIQTGEDESTGYEFTLMAQLLEIWQVVLSYANIDNKIVADPTRPFNVGLRSANIPEHQGSLWNRVRFREGPLEGLGIGLGILYVGERRGNAFLADRPGLRSPAYTRVDANLSYKLKILGQDVSAAINVQNLLDKEYLRSYSGWGLRRNYAASLTYRF